MADVEEANVDALEEKKEAERSARKPNHHLIKGLKLYDNAVYDSIKC
jgi:hypothetical protein